MGRERRDGRGRRDVVVVGLTGGIGAGKSTALALFAQEGAQVLSADEVVHGLYHDADVCTLIGEHFGRGVLSDDGRSVDRACLAAVLRGRRDELHWLESLTHPLVAAEIERRIDAASPGTVMVCEIPLLFESGLEQLFDLVVTIEAGEEIRRLRSVHGFDLRQFGELEDRQLSSTERAAASDLVFYNDGAPQELAGFVHRAYEDAQGRLAVGTSETTGPAEVGR